MNIIDQFQTYGVRSLGITTLCKSHAEFQFLAKTRRLKDRAKSLKTSDNVFFENFDKKSVSLWKFSKKVT